MIAPVLSTIEVAQFQYAQEEAERFLNGINNNEHDFQGVRAPKEFLLQCLDVIDEELTRFRHQPGAGWKVIEIEILKDKVKKRDL